MSAAKFSASRPRRLAVFLAWPLAAWPLLSCAGLSRPIEKPAPPVEQIVSITRELASSDQHTFIRTIRRSVCVTDPQVRDFLHLHPGLAEGIPESDLRFLQDLARLPGTRGLLTGEVNELEWGNRIAVLQPVFSDSDRLSGRTDNRIQAGFLNPIDRIKVLLLLEALQSADLADRIADCLRKDLKEKDAEYGGFLLLSAEEEPPVEFVPVRSRVRDDWEYRPPASLFSLADFAVWHNHVQSEGEAELEQVDNSHRAGPSGMLGGSITGIGGDLWGCYLQTVDAVVITPTGGRTFNVDFASSEGAVVDLGLYSWRGPE